MVRVMTYICVYIFRLSVIIAGPIAGPSNASTSALFPDNFSYTQEEMSPALEYVQKIRQRFAGDEDQYLEFLDILNSYKRKPVDQVGGSTSHVDSSKPFSRQIGTACGKNTQSVPKRP